MSIPAPSHPLLGVFRRAEPLTGRELAQMPDLGPCELIAGRIVRMSPTSWIHGRYVVRITNALSDFVTAHDLGEVHSGEVGIYTGRNPDTVRGADVLFISDERLARVSSQSYLDVAPELVVEVLSPGNRADDMGLKVYEYLNAGVGHVWVVEPMNHVVQIHGARGGGEARRETDVLRGEGLLEGFALPLSTLFGE